MHRQSLVYLRIVRHFMALAYVRSMPPLFLEKEEHESL